MKTTFKDVVALGQRRQKAKHTFHTLRPVAKQLRERAGLTQPEMGGLVGVSAGEICRWEQGERFPRAAALERYVLVLAKLAQQKPRDADHV